MYSRVHNVDFIPVSLFLIIKYHRVLQQGRMTTDSLCIKKSFFICNELCGCANV